MLYLEQLSSLQVVLQISVGFNLHIRSITLISVFLRFIGNQYFQNTERDRTNGSQQTRDQITEGIATKSPRF